MELITVVIPLYNKELYIKRAIQSVLNQTFQNFEVIVVDDGSTDRGPSLARSILDPRIKIIHQVNSGAAAARNRGIEEARGSLIAFLDADDTWKPYFLETICKLKEKFPNVGAYATAYEIKYPSGKIVIPKFKAIPSPPWEGLIPRYFCSVIGPPPVWTSAVAVPKEVFEKIGKFAIGEPLGEDMDMWGRIALKYPIAFSWRVGATYHRDAVNRTSNICSDFMKRNRPFIRTAQRMIKNNEVHPEVLKDLRKYIALRQIKDASICLLWAEDPNTARKMLNKVEPTCIRSFLLKWWWFFLTGFSIEFLHLLFFAKQKLLGIEALNNKCKKE